MTAGSARYWSRRLGVSLRTVTDAVRSGELRAAQLGQRRWTITASAVEEWLAAHAVKPTAHAEERVQRILEREGAA